MNKFLQGIKEIDNYTYTENGAVARKSTGNRVLDAFGSLSAMKDRDEETILNTFYRAFYENQELAMRLLFYVRDVRGGQGMRRVFRIIARSLAFKQTDLIINNLENFLFFGRGDDLICLMGTPAEEDAIDYMTVVLNEDLKAVENGGSCTLLAKWMPSENTSSQETRIMARKIMNAMGLSPKQYRHMLSTLRKEINIVEEKMSANEWDEIDFSKLPSRASLIYSDAMYKHEPDRYIQFLMDVGNGKSKVNATTLFPSDIVSKIGNGYSIGKTSAKDIALYDAMWKALPNYFGDEEETGICVVDTSGSMWGTPMDVAVSLGIYCADKCKGPFKDHFITFSEHPTLQEIVGDNIVEKVRNLEKADWDMNTNIEAVFDLILQTAVSNHLAQEDLPSKLYIISDMQWDESVCTEHHEWNRWDSSREYCVKPETFIATMQTRFSENGYTMPAIVYWNVRASECGMFQEGTDGNCCMVSGYSPSLFKSVMEGTEYVEEINEKGEKVVKQKLDPITIMTNTLMNARYDRVYVG